MSGFQTTLLVRPFTLFLIILILRPFVAPPGPEPVWTVSISSRAARITLPVGEFDPSIYFRNGFQL